MILKIFGSFLIILSSYTYGVLKYGDMKKEVKILKEFSDNLVYLKNEICFAKPPLCGIIGNLSEKDGILSDFYKSFMQKISDSADIENKWCECCETLSLGKSKKELVKKISECFSYADIEGQSAKIDMSLAQLASETEKTEEYIEKNAKLYKNIGLYAGITAAVLLI